MSAMPHTPSAQALAALAELEMMDGATDAAKLIGQAMAGIDHAVSTTSKALAAGSCTLAAARLIRAAEILSEEQNPYAPGAEEPAGQAGEGAGSEPASLPPNAGPSPSPATQPESGGQ